MALHMRDQIMDAIITALTGLTTTASRVYGDRDELTEPLENNELPGLTVNQVSESTEAATLAAPRRLTHALDVDIVALVKRTTNTLTRKQLNLIDQEIQSALGANAAALSLGVGAKYISKVQSDFEIVGDADKPIGRARFRYQVLYLTDENAPDVAV